MFTAGQQWTIPILFCAGRKIKGRGKDAKGKAKKVREESYPHIPISRWRIRQESGEMKKKKITHEFFVCFFCVCNNHPLC